MSGDDHLLQRRFWAWTLAKAVVFKEQIWFYAVFVAQLLGYHHFTCTSTPQSAPSWSCCRPLRWPLACIWRHLLADYKPAENNKSLSVDNGAINSAQVPTDSSRLRTPPVFETVFKRLSISAPTDQRPSTRGQENNLFPGSRAKQTVSIPLRANSLSFYILHHRRDAH